MYPLQCSFVGIQLLPGGCLRNRLPGAFIASSLNDHNSPDDLLGANTRFPRALPTPALRQGTVLQEELLGINPAFQMTLRLGPILDNRTLNVDRPDTAPRGALSYTSS
jgi:hypothetical protein